MVGKPLRVSQYTPIKVVGNVPVYSGKTKEGLIKSDYWSVVVDYACCGVPDIHVRGGRVHECRSLEESEKSDLYDGRYPVVMRVEYRFPFGKLKRTYKNVCKFTYSIESLVANLNQNQRGI